MSFPKIDGFVVTEKIGAGSYATVYKAFTKVGARSVVAIKCIEKSSIKHSETAIDKLINEIRLLKTLKHNHIVQMIDFVWDNKNIYIITEYCCGGDLSKYIKRFGRVPEKQVKYFLQQLVMALKFMREKDVVHMDLKPHNLLLQKSSDGRYTLKVADFGFAQYMSPECKASFARGSPLYMAPEMFLQSDYDSRVDLWSLGVIMYECLFGRAPYASPTFKELMDKIQNRTPIEIPKNSSISQECRSLLTGLLQHDPELRITYEQLFELPYLDLKYAPTDENYEKAVNLIKQAVEKDSLGDLNSAFVLYRESLKYLVPRISIENSEIRVKALRDKVKSYMNRAEEIQNILYGNVNKEEINTNAQELIQTSQPTKNEPISTDISEFNLNTNSEVFTSEEKVNLPSTSQNKKPSKRLDFAKKFFSRRNQSVDGMLDNKDVNKEDDLPLGENVDKCKIT